MTPDSAEEITDRIIAIVTLHRLVRGETSEPEFYTDMAGCFRLEMCTCGKDFNLKIGDLTTGIVTTGGGNIDRDLLLSYIRNIALRAGSHLAG